MPTFEEWKTAKIADEPSLRRTSEHYLRQIYENEFGNQEHAEKEAREKQLVEAVILTTTPEVPGHRVVRIVDIVTAECVFGMNMLRDFLASMTNAFGGRSQATQRVLRDARITCLTELRKEALMVGANAVIGVDLDYSELSGQRTALLFLVATGTAVVVEPIDGSDERQIDKNR